MSAITNEEQIRKNLGNAIKAKKFLITETSIDLLYQKYVTSPPGTTYIAVVNANAHFLTKNCGTCG